MSKKTMFIVGMMMIATLVGFGASAAAPAEIEDGLAEGSRAIPLVNGIDDNPPNTPIDNPLKYADSWGLYWVECSCPGYVLPEPTEGDPSDLL